MKTYAKLMLMVGIGLLVGCQRQQDIETYQAPKEDHSPRVEPPPALAQTDPGQNTMPAGHPPVGGGATAPAQPATPPGHPPLPGMGAAPQGTPAESGVATTAGTLSWTMPAGWKALPPSGMRLAVFQVSPENPQIQLTVIPLGIEAGDVTSNVNRWEQQLGLPPTPKDKLKDVVKHIDLPGDLDADAVDLTGSPEGADGAKLQMLAAIVPQGQTVWFFKVVGPPDVVGPQKKNFDAYIASLRAGAPAPAPATVPARVVPPPVRPPADPATGAVAAGNVRLTGWKVPPGWTQDPARQMRVVSFTIGAAPNQAAVIVSKFPKGNIGGVLDNLNRWRTQAGLEPVKDVKDQPSKPIKIGGRNAALYELTGPQNALDAVWADLGDESWFIKLQGPAQLVTDQRKNFEQFLQSLQFEGEPR